MPVARVIRRDLLDLKYQRQLIGAKDGINQVFAAPEDFAPDTIRVLLNGVRLEKGSGCDYTISESGGAGTGYDTITFEAAVPFPIKPITTDNLFADYHIA